MRKKMGVRGTPALDRWRVLGKDVNSTLFTAQ